MRRGFWIGPWRLDDFRGEAASIRRFRCGDWTARVRVERSLGGWLVVTERLVQVKRGLRWERQDASAGAKAAWTRTKNEARAAAGECALHFRSSTAGERAQRLRLWLGGSR